MAERISLEKLDNVFDHAVGTLKLHTDVRYSTLRCYYLAALVTSFMDYGNSFPGHHANISPWSNSPACHWEELSTSPVEMSPPHSRSHRSNFLGLAIQPFPPEAPPPSQPLSNFNLCSSHWAPHLLPSAGAWPLHLAAFSEDAALPCGPVPPSLLRSPFRPCPSLPPGLAFTQQLSTVLLGLINYSELFSHQVRAPSSLCQPGCTQKHIDHRC